MRHLIASTLALLIFALAARTGHAQGQQPNLEAPRDICRSYKAHGFTDIILVGDSGGNQRGMENVAKALNAKWTGDAARVHFLPEYYSEDQWSWDFLKSQGIVQIDKTRGPGQAADRRTDTRNGMHDDVYYEAQAAVRLLLTLR